MYRKDSILAMRQLMEKKGDLETRPETSCCGQVEAVASHFGMANGLKTPLMSIPPVISDRFCSLEGLRDWLPLPNRYIIYRHAFYIK